MQFKKPCCCYGLLLFVLLNLLLGFTLCILLASPSTSYLGLIFILLQLDKCRKLIQIAENALKHETNYYYGIEACNEVLDNHGNELGSKLLLESLCTRAALLLKVCQELQFKCEMYISNYIVHTNF